MADDVRPLAIQQPGYATAPQALPPVLDFAGGSLNDKWKMAEMLAQSQLVPKDFRGKPGDILIVADLAASLAMSVAQALQTIACINGRAVMWGDGLIALVRRSPRCEWIKEEEIGEKDKDSYGYRCSAKRDDDTNIIVNEFTRGDAKTAKLLDKDGPWKLYGPRRMCRMRARSWTLRDAFADVLKGLGMREEVVDMPNEMRDAVVKAATRTDALKAALKIQDAIATTPAIPLEPVRDDTPEAIAKALDAAAENDPDFAKMTGVEIKEYVTDQNEQLGLKPWELSEVAKATDDGRLIRGNVVAILRLMRERAFLSGDGITAPVVPEEIASQVEDEIPALEDAQPSQEVESPSQVAEPRITNVTPTKAVTHEELLEKVTSAAAGRISEVAMKIAINAHADHGKLTPANVDAVLAEIEKLAKKPK